MWWFTQRAQGQPVAPAITPAQQAEADLLALAPDLSAMLDSHDAVLKIWLPEIVARTVKLLAERAETSQSAWLRQRLVAYVYGRVALVAMQVRHARQANEVRFSLKPVDRTRGRWIYKVPQLGKNTIAFKLWLGAPLQRDLQTLAAHAQVAVSAFVREVIVSDLLGHASLPERPQLTGCPTPAAAAWERGDPVPMRDVEEDAPDLLGDPEKVWQDER